jgi:hypothetical protein
MDGRIGGWVVYEAYEVNKKREKLRCLSYFAGIFFFKYL